jgi:hypothetical protein
VREYIIDIAVYREEGLILVPSGFGCLIGLFNVHAYGTLLIRDNQFFMLVCVNDFVVFAIVMRPLNADVS